MVVIGLHSSPLLPIPLHSTIVKSPFNKDKVHYALAVIGWGVTGWLRLGVELAD